MREKEIVIGVTGASGTVLAYKVLSLIRKAKDWKVHLVLTTSAIKTMKMESDYQLEDFIQLSDSYYQPDEMEAGIASGTFKTDGMMVVPCSMKTLAGIYSGYSDNLLLRSADVTIKQKRKLVLVVRETPLSPLHLRNMMELAALGCFIMPPVLSFYHRPNSLDEMIAQVAGKLLDEFGIESEGYKRWS